MPPKRGRAAGAQSSKSGPKGPRWVQEDALQVAQEAEENVFLFVPNLIGYARVALAAISLYYMRGNPKVCTVLYGVSCLLDAFDGMFARRLDQCTKFGSVLDMVTDRCTTACLLCFLTAAYPNYALLFQGLITLDFSSHYIHMYSTLVTGSTSHKIVGSDVSRILWYYYNDSVRAVYGLRPLTLQRTLFFFCACNELFFVCLYLMAFYRQPLELSVVPFLPRDALAFLSAHRDGILAHALLDVLPQITWPQLLGGLTLPVCAAKQVINGVQFWKAAKTLVGIDLLQRREARAGKRK